jgi:hypothetical protein
MCVQSCATCFCFMTLRKVRDHFISTVSRLSQAVQHWSGGLDDLLIKLHVAAADTSPDLSSASHNNAVFKAFFSSSSVDDTTVSESGPISATPPAANDAAIRLWRSSSSCEANRHESCIDSPPYGHLLSGYLLSAATAASAIATEATLSVESQLTALAAAPPDEVFRKILSEKSPKSFGSDARSNTNLVAAAAFAAAAGTAIPQQFSLGSDRVLQPHHAPLWAESMGELAAGLICLQQLRGADTSTEDAQSFCDYASNMWSHSAIMSNYLNVTATLHRNPPSRIRMPAAAPQVTPDAWWLPDTGPVSVVVSEDAMWKCEWPELLGSAGTNVSWEAAARCATAKSKDAADFSPWKEEDLVSGACDALASGDMPTDLINIGGVEAVAEHVMYGTSGRVPLKIVEAIFAVSDTENLRGSFDGAVVRNGELLCDLLCNIGAGGGEGTFEAAVAALNCSDWMSLPLSLQALSYALSLYNSHASTPANPMSATPPPSPGLPRKTPTPTPRKISLASASADL